MVSNRSMGTSFEHEFAEMLYAEGFWTLNVTQNAAGQASDIITVKNSKAKLIDCKVCQNDRFTFSRVEDNQRTSMEMWQNCGNGSAWFALKTSEGIYMVAYETIKELEYEKKSMNMKDIETFGLMFEEWVDYL